MAPDVRAIGRVCINVNLILSREGVQKRILIIAKKRLPFEGSPTILYRSRSDSPKSLIGREAQNCHLGDWSANAILSKKSFQSQTLLCNLIF